MRACPRTGRTPKSPRVLIPRPPPSVPTVVAIRTERAQIRMVIRTAMTTFNNVIDDQPATDTTAGRAAVQAVHRKPSRSRATARMRFQACVP